mgnify:FL=1
MRDISACTGSEGGEAKALPAPIKTKRRETMNTLQKFVWLVFLPLMFIHTDAAVSSERKLLILPEYFKETAIKKTDKIEKKISGLLKFQVQLRKSYVKQSTPERLSAMKKMGMKTEEIDKHLVYVHAEKKLSASEIKSLKKMGEIVGEDSWIPPLKNHPTGFVIASMPVNRLYELAKNHLLSGWRRLRKSWS